MKLSSEQFHPFLRMPGAQFLKGSLEVSVNIFHLFQLMAKEKVTLTYYSLVVVD